MTAYLGLQDQAYPQLLSGAETATHTLDNDDLETAAPDTATAEHWKQLGSDLNYILVNTCDDTAATICRQHATNTGFEIWRQLHIRFSIPIGTRSIGYLTKLLKPQFDEHKFEESYTTWEFEVTRYERDNNTTLPDNVKIAILLNETKGPLQQHLQLQAGSITTYAQIRSLILEYHRASTAFARLHTLTQASASSGQGPAPMDIGGTWHKGGKNNKGKGKGKHKGKYNKGKGYGGYGNKGNNTNYNTGYNKGKGQQGPIGQGNPYGGGKGFTGFHKGKGKGKHKGKGYSKGAKGKTAMNICYRCGQPGHFAKNCQVPVYNLDTDGDYNNTDPSFQWYNTQDTYDNTWYNQDQTPYNQAPQLALPAAPTNTTPLLVSGIDDMLIGAIQAADTSDMDNRAVQLMIDSGAATHVCPTWFATDYPLQQIQEDTGPQLRTVTNQPIKVHGYKWICMQNDTGQHIVIPFYVCDVKQPILSVTRLVQQGFKITLDEQPNMQHSKGFHSNLVQQNGLLFLQMHISIMADNMELQVRDTPQGQVATIAPITTIAPTTLTPTGADIVRGGTSDLWQYNNSGELVRVHRVYRKALFTPERTECPVSLDKLENYRRTTVKKQDGATYVIEEQYQTLDSKQQHRTLPHSWKGETVFRIKKQHQQSAAQQQQMAAKQQQTAAQSTTTIGRQAATRITPHVISYNPKMRLTTKTTPQAQGIPQPHHMTPTSDYWIREGHLWKRVHVLPRQDFYIPENTTDGPDIKNLTPFRGTRSTKVGDNNEHKYIEDEWTTQPNKSHDFLWTGSTNFEENAQYDTQLHPGDDEEAQQQARRAKAIPAPKQPTAQELAEHELTHLPYRSWCKICTQSRGKADAHKQQQQTSRSPVIQLDFAYLKSFDDPAYQTTPVLTAIDIQTGMMMAVLIRDKQQQFEHAVQQLQTFLLECGRTHAILQSDQEDYLKALIKTTAHRVGHTSEVLANIQLTITRKR